MSGIGNVTNGSGREDIAEDLEDLKSDIEDRVERLRVDADESTRRILDEIQDGIAQLYEEIAEQGGRAIETIEQSVEEHPWAGILVGFGLGCLVTQFIFRRR